MPLINNHIVEIPGIGRVLFERSRRAKRINICIQPRNGVRVAVPYRISFAAAENVVRVKISWIQKHLAKTYHDVARHDNLPKITHSLSKKEIRASLKNRLDELAVKHGFVYNRLFVRTQKTMWGSCSAQNNINLNSKLLNLPENLMDFVIIHELLHTKIKNHGKTFWLELDKLTNGQAHDLRSRLKQYRLSLL